MIERLKERSKALHAEGVFRDPRAVTDTGRAVVAGAGGDLREPVRHAAMLAVLE